MVIAREPAMSAGELVHPHSAQHHESIVGGNFKEKGQNDQLSCGSQTKRTTDQD